MMVWRSDTVMTFHNTAVNEKTKNITHTIVQSVANPMMSVVTD